MAPKKTNQKRGSCINGHLWMSENQMPDNNGGVRCKPCYDAAQARIRERIKSGLPTRAIDNNLGNTKGEKGRGYPVSL